MLTRQITGSQQAYLNHKNPANDCRLGARKSKKLSNNLTFLEEMDRNERGKKKYKVANIEAT